MSKKRRDHKKAIARRRQRQPITRKMTRKQLWKSVTKAYIGKSETVPMPTLVDGLSARSIKDVDSIQKGIKSVTKYFNEHLEGNARHHKKEISLPNNVISFIIPLDFYIALPEPYNAMNISLTEDTITTANCVTIVSDNVTLDSSAVKISYLIVSLCKDEYGEIEQIVDEHSEDIFQTAIDESNNVIAAFQAISTRHNHYMHKITRLSCAALIDAFIFQRESGKIISEESVTINGNVHSEIFQSRPLLHDELEQFSIAHVNNVFTKDKIFDLISKYNSAINARCFGNDEESILLSDSYTELTIGYVLCEVLINKGNTPDEVYAQYKALESLGDVVALLASEMSLSNTKMRKQIGFDEWYKYCRIPRNNLTHRWITGKVNGDESLHALHYSGNLINKLCQLIQGQFPEKEYYELFDKMDLLISASHFVQVLHKDIEQNDSSTPKADV